MMESRIGDFAALYPASKTIYCIAHDRFQTLGEPAGHPVQSVCRAKRGAARRLERWHFWRGHDPPPPRSARSRPGTDPQRNGPASGAAGVVPATAGLSDELHHPRNFLGRPANPAKPTHPIRPASWGRAIKAGVVRDGIPSEAHDAIRRRIIGSQTLYAFGAVLCVVSTYASIAFIVLVQLNFAFAPRLRWLSRI